MARIVTIDFTGVESGSKFIRMPEGDYSVKMASVKGKTSESSNQKYLAAVFEITGPKGKGKKIGHSFSLQKQSLWNLRNWIEATGKSVPQKALKIDLDKFIGLECACTIVDDAPYEGKIKSIISAFFPIDDLGKTSEDGSEIEEEVEETEGEAAEEEEVEEKPTKKAAKKAPKKTAKKAVEEEEEESEAEESSEEEDLFS